MLPIEIINKIMLYNIHDTAVIMKEFYSQKPTVTSEKLYAFVILGYVKALKDYSEFLGLDISEIDIPKYL
jgi:hypothetical protein